MVEHCVCIYEHSNYILHHDGVICCILVFESIIDHVNCSCVTRWAILFV